MTKRHKKRRARFVKAQKDNREASVKEAQLQANLSEARRVGRTATSAQMEAQLRATGVAKDNPRPAIRNLG